MHDAEDTVGEPIRLDVYEYLLDFFILKHVLRFIHFLQLSAPKQAIHLHGKQNQSEKVNDYDHQIAEHCESESLLRATI